MMKPVEFVYKNHKGETKVRRVTPASLDFISNPGFGYQPGWFLTGYDHDKDATRSFRLSHIILDYYSTHELMARIKFEEE